MEETKFDEVPEEELESAVGGRHRKESDSWMTHVIEFGKGFLNSFATTGSHLKESN